MPLPSDPFRRAAEAMATTMLAEDAIYQFKDGAIGMPVRVIMGRADASDGGSFGRPGKVSTTAQATIAASVFGEGRPRPGDLIALGTGPGLMEKASPGWVVKTVQQDIEGVSYTLGLGRQE